MDRQKIAALEDGFRRVLSLSASAGTTITNRDALDVIRSIANLHVHGDARGVSVLAARPGAGVEAHRG
jgi:hypothetical protein